MEGKEKRLNLKDDNNNNNNNNTITIRIITRGRTVITVSFVIIKVSAAV